MKLAPKLHRLNCSIQELDDLRAQLTAALEAQEKAERERDNVEKAFESVSTTLEVVSVQHDEARSLLASATDFLNSFARESGVPEARNELAIKTVIDWLWQDATKTRFERDEARATIQRQAERIAELERQVQEAEKDTARLDHVFNHMFVVRDIGPQTRRIWTTREDLDAAIAAPEQEKP